MNLDTDLELTRHFIAPPAKVWRCWTEPDLLARWFAPKPVVTRDVVIDLCPGGRFSTLMIVPDHGEQPTEGCFLEIIPQRRLVFTDLLHEGFRPAATTMFGFTAVITLDPDGTGTRYTARALHKDREIRDQHAAMGFHEGWGAAAAQLDALAFVL